MNCPNCQQPMQRFKARHVPVVEVKSFTYSNGPTKRARLEWVPQCFECDDCDLREIDISGEYLGGDQYAS